MGIRLQGLNLGYIGLDREMLMFPHPDYILHSQRQAGSKVWCECPVVSYVIDHPDGKILFESGMSTSYHGEWLPEWEFMVDLTGITPDKCVEARLSSIGLGPEDFRYVIQGHLHSDHAGGMRVFQEGGSEILVHEKEWNYVETVTSPEYFFVPEDWQFLQGVKRPVLIDEDQEIMKGVHLISLPGHTPGTMAVLLELDHTGKVILCRDVMQTHENCGPPPVSSPLNMDQAAWFTSIEKMRKIAHENDAWVLPGHDDIGVQFHNGQTEFKDIDFESGTVYE